MVKWNHKVSFTHSRYPRHEWCNLTNFYCALFFINVAIRECNFAMGTISGMGFAQAHSHIASENLLVSPLEGKFKTTIFAVVVWQTMNSYHNSRGVVVWLYAMSYHNSRQTSTVVVWIHMCHTTTSGEMTKFSLSLWEWYICTIENNLYWWGVWSVKFLHSVNESDAISYN